MAARGRALSGDTGVPGDKSISHRAVMLAALADGVSRIDGFLEARTPAPPRRSSARWACASMRIRVPRSSTALGSTACARLRRCSTAATRAPPCGSCPACSRGNPSTPCSVATRRCRAGRCCGSWRHCARWVPRSTPTTASGRHCASLAGIACRASASIHRWPARRSSPRCCWPGSTPRVAPRCTSRIRPATTPNACCRHSAGRLTTRPAWRAWLAAIGCARATSKCRVTSRLRPS